MGTGWNPVFIMGSSLPNYLERTPFIRKGGYGNICTTVFFQFRIIFIYTDLEDITLSYSIFIL